MWNELEQRLFVGMPKGVTTLLISKWQLIIFTGILAVMASFAIVVSIAGFDRLILMLVAVAIAGLILVISGTMKSGSVISIDGEINRVSKSSADIALVNHPQFKYFVRELAYNMNNLLSGIIGYSEMIRDNGAGNGKTKSRIEAIFSSGMQMKEIIFKLNNSCGLGVSRKDFINPNLLIREASQIITESERDKLKIKVVDKAPECRLFCDHQTLRSALVGLGMNAVKATSAGGTITLTAKGKYANNDGEQALEGISIEIEDTGKGMAPEILKHAPDLFYTPYGSVRNPGLGIPQAIGVVAAHDGSLEIDSKPEAGTKVRIFLPL